MEPRYQFNSAVIDKENNMCIEVRTSTNDHSGYENDNYYIVSIPEYDNSYIFKYHNRETGKWYTDAEMQNEWIPPVA